MFIMIPMRNMQQNYLIFSHSSFRMPDSPQQDETQQRLLKVEQDILGANNQLADMNRRFLPISIFWHLILFQVLVQAKQPY